MRRPQALFVLVFLAVPLFAQTPLIEKIDVSVVNVDVTVTDRAGNPVHGLKRDDFEVFEDEKPQKITNFYAVENQKTGQPVDERFRRNVLVIVDNLTGAGFRRDRALDRLEEFINDRFTGGQYDWSLAVVDRGAQMLLAPTSDKKQIFEAIGEVRKMFAGEIPRLSLDGDFSAGSCSTQRLSGMLNASDRLMLAANEANSAATVVQAIRGFSGVPGKKIILLLTTDVALRFDPLSVTDCMPPGTQTEFARMAREQVGAREYVVREANASNVSLYIINTEGLRAGAWESAQGVGARGGMSEHYVPSTDNGSLFWLARQTGGRLLPGNYVERSLDTFDAASSNFYSLGYRASHGDDGRYHRIRVRLKREGRFDLQYRDGYTNLPSALQLIRLLQSPIAPAMQTSSIPVALSFGAPTSTNGILMVPVSASVSLTSLTVMPSAHTAPVEVFISLFDDRGRNVQLVRFERQAKAGDQTFVEQHALRLEKGTRYRVVVAVRDPLTEAFGIAQQVVTF
jgi:VWFA-related protein